MAVRLLICDACVHARLHAYRPALNHGQVPLEAFWAIVGVITLICSASVGVFCYLFVKMKQMQRAQDEAVKIQKDVYANFDTMQLP